MKRLTGVTLAKRLDDKRATIQPLLRAFVDVCLAIEFAHSRGVIHRDLKPSNIMLGDFGEVYVLDWGVARVLTDRVAVDRADAGDATIESSTTSTATTTGLDPRHARLHGARADARPRGRARRRTSTRSARSCSRSSPASRCIRAARPRSRRRSTHPQVAPTKRSAAIARSRPSSTSCATTRSPRIPTERPTRARARRADPGVPRRRSRSRAPANRSPRRSSRLRARRSRSDAPRRAFDRDARAGRALALDPESQRSRRARRRADARAAGRPAAEARRESRRSRSHVQCSAEPGRDALVRIPVLVLGSRCRSSASAAGPR